MPFYAHTMTDPKTGQPLPKSTWEPLFTPFGEDDGQCQRDACETCTPTRPPQQTRRLDRQFHRRNAILVAHRHRETRVASNWCPLRRQIGFIQRPSHIALDEPFLKLQTSHTTILSRPPRT